jgi:hypothetical protein
LQGVVVEVRYMAGVVVLVDIVSFPHNLLPSGLQ